MKTFYSHREDWPAGGMVRLFVGYGLTQVKDPAMADIIIWNGGEDIGTVIYGDNAIPGGGPFKESGRDLEEQALFNKFAERRGKLLVGICRGAQLLNCLNGGKLWQDVDGHSGSHPMVDLRTGEVLTVTSTHHQQMRPGPDGEVIGLASRSTIKRADGVEEHPKLVQDLKLGADTEIVWYPATHTLCIQGHPEYVPQSRFAAYTLELIKTCYKECG